MEFKKYESVALERADEKTRIRNDRLRKEHRFYRSSEIKNPGENINRQIALFNGLYPTPPTLYDGIIQDGNKTIAQING